MEETLSIEDLRNLSFHKIERLQNARFRAAVRYLLPETKFYSELFKQYKIDPSSLETIDDWQKQGLPLLNKFYYMKHIEDFIVKPKNPFNTHTGYTAELHTGKTAELFLDLLNKQVLRAKLHYFYNPKMPLFSGGTQSGRPTPTFVTQSQLQNLQNTMAIAVQMMSSELQEMNTVGMNLFPYGPHLAWHAVQTAFNLGVNMNLATAAGGAMRTKDLVIMADKFKANVFAGMAFYIANRFLPMAIKKKIKLGPKAVFINGSEEMTQKDKEKIISQAKKIGIKNPAVLDFYGASELKEAIMPECTEESGFHHISSLSTIIKTVKINTMPKKEKLITDWEFTKNSGAAVIWNIGGAGTIMHGYAIGDYYEKIIKEKCTSCKMNVETIHGVKRLKWN